MVEHERVNIATSLNGSNKWPEFDQNQASQRLHPAKVRVDGLPNKLAKVVKLDRWIHPRIGPWILKIVASVSDFNAQVYTIPTQT